MGGRGDHAVCILPDELDHVLIESPHVDREPRGQPGCSRIADDHRGRVGGASDPGEIGAERLDGRDLRTRLQRRQGHNLIRPDHKPELLRVGLARGNRRTSVGMIWIEEHEFRLADPLLLSDVFEVLQDRPDLIRVTRDRIEIVRRLRRIIEVRRIAGRDIRDLVLADGLLECLSVARAPTDNGVDLVDIAVLPVEREGVWNPIAVVGPYQVDLHFAANTTLDLVDVPHVVSKSAPTLMDAGIACWAIAGACPAAETARRTTTAAHAALTRASLCIALPPS